MNINHERLVPGAITYWGDVVGDITDQQDLVDYVASHGGGGGSGDATWGSIQGTLSNQTDLNNRLTGLDQYDLDNYNFTKDVSNSLDAHAAQNAAQFSGIDQSLGNLNQLVQKAQSDAGDAIQENIAQDARLEAIDAKNAQQDARMTAIEAKNAEQDDRLTNDEVHIKAVSDITDTLSDAVNGLDKMLSDLEDGTVVPLGTATETWVQNQGYITSSALSGYATESYVQNQGYATESYVQGQGYITSSALSGYATEQWVWDRNFIQIPGDGWDVPYVHNLDGDPNYEGSKFDLSVIPPYFDIDAIHLFGSAEVTDVSLSFNGFCWDWLSQKLGLYKLEGIEEDPENAPGEITYNETFIPFVAAEEPDTSTNATYVLKATVLNGQVTYNWVPDNVL